MEGGASYSTRARTSSSGLCLNKRRRLFPRNALKIGPKFKLRRTAASDALHVGGGGGGGGGGLWPFDCLSPEYERCRRCCNLIINRGSPYAILVGLHRGARPSRRPRCPRCLVRGDLRMPPRGNRAESRVADMLTKCHESRQWTVGNKGPSMAAQQESDKGSPGARLMLD